MEKIVINGGIPLRGTIEIGGMKNGALPIIFASLLVDGRCIIENVPAISDVYISLDILQQMGASVRMLDKNTVELDTQNIKGGSAPIELVRKLRASYYLLGSELGRFGKAYVGYPGGCDFGVRPIDQHIKGFEALGAKVTLEGGYIKADAAEGLVGTNVFFDEVTVGGTMNIMLAAVKAPA